MQTDVGAVEDELFPVCPVVGYHGHLPPHADQKLVALMVRVLAPGFDARHIEHHEVTLDLEWDRSLEFADRKASAYVRHTRQAG